MEDDIASFGQPYGLGFSQDQVDVRWIALDTLDAPAVARLETCLDDRERETAGRFRADDDRRAYIAAHALVRLMLSHGTPIRPNHWHFLSDTHGKPELALPASSPRIRTSLSHTTGLVAAAVTVDHDVGVDVEDFTTDAFITEVAQSVLAPAEVEALLSLAETQRPQMFGAIWTLKEAYAKAVGLGLTIPFQSFSIALEGADASLSLKAEPASDWLLWHHNPTHAHALGVAVRPKSGRRVRITARPFGIDQRQASATIGVTANQTATHR
jgi:4'-phosphopantetheinyl transferase